MDELIPWLHQQLDAAEARAQAAGGDRWRATYDGLFHQDSSTAPGPFAVGPYGYLDDGERKHIAFHDPERVLRQVAADRRILAEYERLLLRDRARVGPYWDGVRDMCEMAVRARAEAYDDQPGYREVWRQCPTT